MVRNHEAQFMSLSFEINHVLASITAQFYILPSCLPQFCGHREVSDKNLFPTFARTRPSSAQISRSVTSLLLTFEWTQVSFLYSTDPDGNFREVSRTIVEAMDEAGIQIKYVGTWAATYHHGYGANPFEKLVDQSYMDTRSELRILIGKANMSNEMSLKAQNVVCIQPAIFRRAK